MNKRVFIIVLDSFGIGAMPDAAAFGDEGSDTLGAVRDNSHFYCPIMEEMGLFCIDGIQPTHFTDRLFDPKSLYARMTERSMGKDTTIGHWEIAGLISPTPLPTYPNGFPEEVLGAFTGRTGHGILCNRPYSGTDVIRDYGREHLETGKLIVYTSADSVFQIAAHVDKVPVDELYRVCEIARDMLTNDFDGRHAVGRVIARPFEGEHPFSRTSGRHDYSLAPPAPTMLDRIKDAGMDVIAVGKINDIFAGRGITRVIRTADNDEGMNTARALIKENFHGLCFINLVDFDMKYGHRNDADGYASALSEFDAWLCDFVGDLHADDLLMVTADHGCDPSTPSTDHSREYTPLLMYHRGTHERVVKRSGNLGTRETFADVAATALAFLEVPAEGLAGTDMFQDVKLRRSAASDQPHLSKPENGKEST